MQHRADNSPRLAHGNVAGASDSVFAIWNSQFQRRGAKGRSEHPTRGGSTKAKRAWKRGKVRNEKPLPTSRGGKKDESQGVGFRREHGVRWNCAGAFENSLLLDVGQNGPGQNDNPVQDYTSSSGVSENIDGLDGIGGWSVLPRH